MEDIRLELRFKNARLWELIEQRFRAERGERYGCCSLAAKTIGVHLSTLNGLLTLRLSPWSWGHGHGCRMGDGKKERLIKPGQKIADFFLADPYELFPISLYRLQLPHLLTKTMDSERFISFAEARKQKLLPALSMTTDLTLDDTSNAALLREQIETALNTLPNREESVIKMRFGLEDGIEKTLEEVGRHFALSSARIKQIEARALRLLRHSSSARRLKEFIR